MLRAPARTAVALLLVGALAACSAEELDVDGFSPGACTDVAETLQDVDATLRELADEDVEPREAATSLAAAQEDLKPARDDAAQPVSRGITDLITRIGFLRAAVDTNGLDDTEIDDARTALDELVTECRSS